MSHYDPQVEMPLPVEYIERCKSLKDDIRIGKAVIFKWGKYPGVIGKAGTENFWKSLLIGRMDGGQTILLTCDSDGYGRNKRWVYQVAKYAEWNSDWRFYKFDDLLSFLKTYNGTVLGKAGSSVGWVVTHGSDGMTHGMTLNDGLSSILRN